MNLEELLGLTEPSERDRLAQFLVEQDSTLIDELIKARHDRGMSQQDVADQLGLTQSAIAKFESGERDPRLSTIRRYAMAVDATVSHKVDPEKMALSQRGDSGFETHVFIETKRVAVDSAVAQSAVRALSGARRARTSCFVWTVPK